MEIGAARLLLGKGRPDNHRTVPSRRPRHDSRRPDPACVGIRAPRRSGVDPRRPGGRGASAVGGAEVGEEAEVIIIRVGPAP